MPPPPEVTPEVAEVPATPSSVSTHTIVSHPFTTTFIHIKARQLARRSDFSRSDADDLQQDMLMHLLVVADQYDPGRGNVEAFITHVIKRWIAQLLRDRKAEKRGGSQQSASLDQALMDSDGSEATRTTVLNEQDRQRRLQIITLPPIEVLELRDELAHVLSCLSAEQRELVMHAAEHGVLNTARHFGISRRQVRKQIAAARGFFTFSSQNDQ